MSEQVFTLQPGKEGKTKVSPKRNLNRCPEFQPDIFYISICNSSKMFFFLPLFYPRDTLTKLKRSTELLPYQGPPCRPVSKVLSHFK